MLKDVIKILGDADLGDLYETEAWLKDHIERREAAAVAEMEKVGHRRRREVRINTNIRGKVTRITQVRPGENEEYPVQILDISRRGMKLAVKQEYYHHSQIIRIQFLGPTGNTKQNYLEVIRIRERIDANEVWYELGCRSLNNLEVRSLRSYSAQRIPLCSRTLAMVPAGLYVISQQNEFIRQSKVLLSRTEFRIKHCASLEEHLQEHEQDKPHIEIIGPDILQAGALDELDRQESSDCSSIYLLVAADEAMRSRCIESGLIDCILQEEVIRLLLPALEIAVLRQGKRVPVMP